RRRFQPADCHDLVQQTFLQLHRARDRFRAGERLRPWLFTLARNVGCDEGRRASRRPERASDVERWATAIESPEARELRVGDVYGLLPALQQLSTPERRLIDEHFGQERSFGELARRDGVHAGTLRVRAHRAREKLRALLVASAA